MPSFLVDTSVAIPLVVADHQHHEAVTRHLERREVGLAGHAAFETFSVLTRLPSPARRSPAVIQGILQAGFPHTRFLSAAASEELSLRFAVLGISGGAVYDALVGAAAVEHEATLLTRDRRALPTYQALGVPVEVIDSVAD